MHFGAVLYIMGKFRLLPHCALEARDRSPITAPKPASSNLKPASPSTP